MANESVNYRGRLKIIVFGMSNTGKTSLISRFVNDFFNKSPKATIFVNFSTKFYQLDNRLFKFQIWDIADQDIYSKFLSDVYKQADAAIIVYDITEPLSFDRAKYWINEIKTRYRDYFPIALVCNKIDLDFNKNLIENGLKYANDNNLLFIKTSARRNKNIEKIFKEIIKMIPLS